MVDFNDGIPLKGIRREHIAEGAINGVLLENGIIVPSHFASSVYGVVGDITTIDPDDAAAAGASGRLADAAHQHAYTSGTVSALTKTATNTEGSSSSHTRADHGHATNALPWGIVAQQKLTADSTGYTASGASDMLLNNVSVVQGRTYAIHLHSAWQLTPGATFAEWNINLHLNGSVLDHFDKATQYVTQNGFGTFNAIVYWVAPTTQATDDFTVEHVEVSGSYTLTYKAASTTPRYLTIIDMGVL